MLFFFKVFIRVYLSQIDDIRWEARSQIVLHFLFKKITSNSLYKSHLFLLPVFCVLTYCLEENPFGFYPYSSVMVEQLCLITFSHSKEKQNTSAFLHISVGIMVKKTNTNTHTSAWCVRIKSNINAHTHAWEWILG